MDGRGDFKGKKGRKKGMEKATQKRKETGKTTRKKERIQTERKKERKKKKLGTPYRKTTEDEGKWKRKPGVRVGAEDKPCTQVRKVKRSNEKKVERRGKGRKGREMVNIALIDETNDATATATAAPGGKVGKGGGFVVIFRDPRPGPRRYEWVGGYGNMHMHFMFLRYPPRSFPLPRYFVPVVQVI